MNKIFCVGYQKTGTTTFNQAMNLLGFNVCSNEDRISAWKSVIDNNYDKVLSHIISKYQVFEDNPWYWPKISNSSTMPIYQYVFNKYPDSKFILTRRTNSAVWVKSLLEHKARYKGKKSGWNSPQSIFVYGRHANKKIDKVEQQYIDHNNNVRDFFYKNSPNNLLELCFEEGDDWEKICNFFNIEIPLNLAFPHANKKTNKRKSFFEIFFHQ